MDYILQGMPAFLITGATEAEHDNNLEEVLRRLQDNGVRLKQEKCSFYQRSVEYLGHCISADGVHTTKEKTQAILYAKNVQELQSFLGVLSYYAMFIPNLASILHPLHELLRKHQRWQWTQQ